MPLTELEILDRCILLYSKPGRWTKNCCARDRNGRSVNPFSPEARSFCIEGAIRRAAGIDDRTAYQRFVPILAGHVAPHKNPFDWNDASGRSQQDVVRFFEDLADTYRYKETP
jgi:hypothetical protein